MCVRIKIVSVQGVCHPTVRNVTVVEADEEGVPPPRYEDVATQPRPQPLAQCQYNRQYFCAVFGIRSHGSSEKLKLLTLGTREQKGRPKGRRGVWTENSLKFVGERVKKSKQTNFWGPYIMQGRGFLPSLTPSPARRMTSFIVTKNLHKNTFRKGCHCRLILKLLDFLTFRRIEELPMSDHHHSEAASKTYFHYIFWMWK